ncbi:MAG: FIMAH domain-containing protein [Candidatus Methylomirabilis sp.]
MAAYRTGLAVCILFLLSLVEMAMAPAASASIVGYTLVDLGTLGGTTEAIAINELGISAGHGLAAVDGGFASHAAVWSVSDSGVSTRVLGRGEAFDINDLGEVAGLLQFSGPTLWRLKTDGTFDTILLPTLGGVGGHVLSINNTGYAVGMAMHATGTLAALWHITPLGITVQGFSGVDLIAINDNQEIAARSSSGDAIFLFTIQSDGSVTQQLLKTFPSGSLVEVTNINNAGAIVGAVNTETVDEFGDPVFHSEAFILTKDSQMALLPPLAAGGNAVARGINDHFQVVGFSDGLAVLWSPLSSGGYGVTDLGANAIAFDINEASWIAGFSGGHAALWTIPTPAEQVGGLAAEVDSIVSTGALTQGQATSLKAKLSAAEDKLNADDANSAVLILRAFINQVNAQIKAGQMSGKLTQQQIQDLQALIEGAQAIIDRLCSQVPMPRAC